MTGLSDSSRFGWGPLRIERSRLKKIMPLALPIIGGMGSQTLLNLVDTFMVSQLGKDAVAAVGLASFVNFLCTAFITGMSAGVQAMASRRKGEGRDSESAVPLNGALVVVVGLGVPLSILLIAGAHPMFSVVNSDPAVIALGVPYLQIRLIAMISMGSNYSFRGFWNGVSMSHLYLRTLVVMHASNVVISYVLIFGKLGMPALGVNGAATGTTIATFLGTIYYFYLGRRYARGAGFLHGMPSFDTIRTMLRLSVPSGIQQIFFAASFTMLFTIVGMVGTAELAAANVLFNITLVAFLPGLGLGLAAASLVGQALGRRNPGDALAWGWDVGRVAIMIGMVLGLPMLLVPHALLQPFFHNEPQALELAVFPLRLVGATVALDVLGLVLMNAMMGAGATRLAMIVSVSAQWLVFMPVAYLVGPVLGFGLMGIWIAQVCYRGGQSLVLMGLWRSRRWANIDV